MRGYVTRQVVTKLQLFNHLGKGDKPETQTIIQQTQLKASYEYTANNHVNNNQEYFQLLQIDFAILCIYFQVSKKIVCVV